MKTREILHASEQFGASGAAVSEDPPLKLNQIRKKNVFFRGVTRISKFPGHVHVTCMSREFSDFRLFSKFV